MFRVFEILSRRKKVVSLVLLLSLVLLVFGVVQIKLEEDISTVLPTSNADEELNLVLENTSFSDQIIYTLSVEDSTDVDLLTSVADKWYEDISDTYSDQIAQIQGQLSNDDFSEMSSFIYDNIPHFLDQKDLNKIIKQTSRDSIRNQLNQHLKTLISPTGFLQKENIRKDPFGMVNMGFSKFGKLRANSKLILKNGYLLSPNNRHLFLFVTLKNDVLDTDNNENLISGFKDYNHSLLDSISDKITGKYYGAPFIAAANATQIKSDIQTTVSVSFSILIVLLFFFFRKIFVPFLLFLPTIIGALIAINILILFRESVSGISLGIGSVLLGISLDYSIHVLTHLRQGHTVNSVFKTISKPLLVSALTTSGAFFCLLFLPSQALQDLGLFAGISVFLTAILSLLIIPLYYPSANIKNNSWLQKLCNIKTSRRKVIVAFTVLLALVSFKFYDKVKFENDLSKMNFLSQELKDAELTLNEYLGFNDKSVYVISYSHDLNEALNKNVWVYNELRKELNDKNVLGFSSIGGIIKDSLGQLKDLESWQNFTSNFGDSIIERFENEGADIGFKESTFKPFFNSLIKQHPNLSLDDFNAFKSLFNVSNFVNHKNNLFTVVTTVKLNPIKVDSFKSKFSNLNNIVLVDRKAINENLISGLKSNFSQLINYSFLIVFLIVLAYFRRIELALITIIPIILTWGVTLSCMAIFDMNFTIFNIIISSFIFGLGVDYSILMTNALIHDYTYATNIKRDTKIAILLSVITTLLGIGVLILAKHPALLSIAYVCLIGITSCVLITFIIQPVLFYYLTTARTSKGLRPIKLKIAVISFFLLIYFALGGILLSLISVFVLPLLPLKKSSKRRFLHRIMTFHLKVVVKLHPFHKMKIHNANNETFEEPSIIIANHSSSLDNLFLGFLSSRLIYLVKDWVINSPIFGLTCRQLGYVTISNEIYDNISHLKSRLEEGYSVVVFPEGKRSKNSAINRFHKGAFLLQQELEIDLLPIYLLGTSETMAKSNFMIEPNKVDIVVGERIKFNPVKDQKEIRSITKSVSKQYNSNYAKLKYKIQKLDYFKPILEDHFLYKSPELLSFARREFEDELAYNYIDSILDVKCKATVISENLETLSIFLALKFPSRKLKSLNLNNENKNLRLNYFAMNGFTTKFNAVNDLLKDENKVLILDRINCQVPKEIIDQYDKIICYNSLEFDFSQFKLKSSLNKKVLVYEK